MKSIKLKTIPLIISIFCLTGCTQKSNNTVDQTEVIDTINAEVTKQTDILINKEDYTYIIKKQINQDTFVELDDNKKVEEGFEGNITVEAKLKENCESKLKSYFVTYNENTKKLLSIQTQGVTILEEKKSNYDQDINS